MMNTLHTFLRSRRSVRRFRPDAVPSDVIQRILTTAAFAPSAHNNQPWRFVILVKTESKTTLIVNLTNKFRQDMRAEGVLEKDILDRIERTNSRIKQAPVIIVLCQEMTQVNPQSDTSGKITEQRLGFQSVAAAGLQLLLAAHAEGLGGTWICWPLFAPEETRQSLDLPVSWEPQAMFFLGYPAETPELPERKSLQDIAIFK